MAELTLKDESVIDIGQAVGERVQSIASTGTSIVPAGAGAVAPAAVAQPMNPFDSMMTVLSDIRDGIYSLVDKFSEGVSLQQQQIQADEQAQDLNQAAGSEPVDGVGDSEGTDNRSFLQKGKDKVKELMGAGGLKGMLVKGGLIFGLLGIAKLMQKYGKEIAKVLTPIVDGIKTFFSAFSDDIGPLFDKAVGMVKDAIGGLLDIFKGLFTGDAATFFGGVKKLFVDFPIKLVSYIGDAFFSLLENALAAFGIESEMVTDIKMFFRQLPEKISQLFTDIGNFFTVTIPEKLTEIKDSITNFFNDNIVTPIKNLWTDIGNFFTVTIPEKYNEITEKVSTFFSNIVKGIGDFFTDAKTFVTDTIPTKIGEVTDGVVTKFNEIKDSIIDFAMAPFRKIKELMQNLLVGILESVEGLPFIGDKAKALKESILGTGSADTETVPQTGDASVAEQTYTDTANLTIPTSEDGTVLDPKNGKMLKIRDEDAAKLMAGELTASGSGIYEPVYDDGGYLGRAFYKIKKVGVQSGQDFTVSGVGANSGADVNTQSAELASSQGQSMGYVNTGGNDYSVKTNTVTHNSFSEDTTSPDKNSREALYP